MKSDFLSPWMIKLAELTDESDLRGLIKLREKLVDTGEDDMPRMQRNSFMILLDSVMNIVQLSEGKS